MSQTVRFQNRFSPVTFITAGPSAWNSASLPRNRASSTAHQVLTVSSITGRSPTVLRSPLLSRSHLVNHDVQRRSFATAATNSRGSAPTTELTAPNASVLAPSSPSMTLLFTDIASSSALWDADATSMAAAMIAHDKLLRHYMARHTGYEVKQNGDGFMIAFESAGDALAFCVSLQRRFDDIGKGPRRVSGLGEESDESKTDEEVLSKIRLRMCLHHGEPTLQYNALIQRMDFLGPMVNRCARYIQATDPGQIVVSREFLRALHREGTGRTGEVGNTAEEELEELEAELVGRTRNLTIGLRARSKDEGRRRMKFAVQSMGAREFKGVGGRQILYVIMPTGSEEENVSD